MTMMMIAVKCHHHFVKKNKLHKLEDAWRNTFLVRVPHAPGSSGPKCREEPSILNIARGITDWSYLINTTERCS